jgi:hypothetical protein
MSSRAYLRSVLVGLAGAASVVACGDRSATTSAGGGGAAGTTSQTVVTVTSAGGGLPAATAIAPAGWHRWPFTPDDCAVFVPDDLASLEPLTWEPCPYMTDGCRRAGAPWAQQVGWGYMRLMSVSRAGDGLKALMRASEYEGIEVRLYDGDEPIGAWLTRWEGSQCQAYGPQLRGDRALVSLIRDHGPSQPITLEASPDVIFDAPQVLFEFQSSPYPGWPNGAVLRSENLVLYWENEGRITVHDLRDGVNYRPEFPADVIEFGNPELYDDRVFFWGYNYGISSLWTWTPAEGPRVLAGGGTVSYDELDTDGIDMAWIQSTGYLGPLSFQQHELWTSPIARSSAELIPRKVADLPLPGMVGDMVSVGEGWAAIWFSEDDTRLYNLETGEIRRLPLVPGVSFNSGSEGLAIVGGEVWLQSFPFGAAGNDIRWITVFDLAKLPAG